MSGRKLEALVDIPVLPEPVPDVEKAGSVETAISAYDSAIDSFAYVSMPVSTGPTYYDVLESRGVKTVAKLLEQDKDAFVRDILSVNIARGKRVAEKVKRYTQHTVIAPAILNGAKLKWKDPEYMAVDLKIIKEKTKDMFMADGWSYSTGGVREYAEAVSMQFFKRKRADIHVERAFSDNGNISMYKLRYIGECRKKLPVVVFTQMGKTLHIDKGFALVADAIEDLHERGFEYGGIKSSFDPLYKIGKYFQEHSSDFGCAPYAFDWDAMCRAYERISKLA